LNQRNVRPFAFAAAVLAAAAGITTAQEPPKPARIVFKTEEAFSAAGVPAYKGKHDDIYAYIDQNVAAHLAQLQRWVRQPSVSAQSRGIKEMAELLAQDLRDLGFKEVAIVPTSGHPGVFGFYDVGAAKTLVLYMMYDVQPEETGWSVKPFDGALVDTDLGKVLMARGATNQKGPERTFLNALESVIKVKGKAPVNLMLVAEGEEELGSPHYGEVIDKYEERLKKADGVFFPSDGQDESGAVELPLGVKGILAFELTALGGAAGGPTKNEIHSSLKAIVDAPAWRLVHAAAALTSDDGNAILVPGYFDAIRAPNLEEQKLVNGMLKESIASEPVMKKGLSVEKFLGGATGRDLLSQLLFTTTLNINGMNTGYVGEGMKTILPAKAMIRFDSRLVPDQDPDAQLALIKKHLAAKGFADIGVRKISGYRPAQTSVESPIVTAAISVFNKYGSVPSVSPRLAGSAPYYIFTDRLKLPMVMGGIGHGSRAHAPDEYRVIEPKPGSKIAGLALAEKFYVDMLYALAELPAKH
jgi:acetylornithine deacetylase/succinyl-diaminopimelate desuccinylase-like protein